MKKKFMLYWIALKFTALQYILLANVATYLHIACSLTEYAKYMQHAYSGTVNLRDFTYNLHVNVLLIV